MKKYDVYNKIKSEGVVVVIRGNDIQEHCGGLLQRRY